MRNLFLIILSGVLFTLLKCSIGGGSESTGICGTVNYRDFRVADVKVNLVDPDSGKALDSVYTNNDGYFSFDKVANGRHYSLQGFKDSLRFIRLNIMSDTNMTIQLVGTGSIHCTIRLIGDTAVEGIPVYITGTSYGGPTDKNGEIDIFYVPAGEYEIVINKDYYIKERVVVVVSENRTTTVEPITLRIDPDAKPMTPKNLSTGYDTLSGIVTVSWDTVAGHICQYMLHIHDPAKSNKITDGENYTLDAPRFIDTLFLASSENVLSSKSLKFRVMAMDTSGLESGYTPFITSTFMHPTTPPVPGYYLSIVDSCMIVAVHGSVLPAEWIDSIFVYCSVNDSDHFSLKATVSGRGMNAILYDTIRIFPQGADSLFSVFYYLKAKSCFGNFSSSSVIQKIVLKNPYLFYTIPEPSRPEGPPSSANAGSYNFKFSAVASPIKNDRTEYRIRIINTTIDSTYFTAWYSIPSIDTSLDNAGNYRIQSQARSRLLPNLQSLYSDTLSVLVSKSHLIDKPAAPEGNGSVTLSNTDSYISLNNNLCNLGHTVSIRYAVSYQGSVSPDTTNWIYPPDKKAAIVFSATGTAYIRAQTRCIEDTLIVSPWSDALVVTVK